MKSPTSNRAAAPDPIAVELAAAGVEINVSAPGADPQRVKFRETRLKDGGKDLRLELDDGTVLRERFVRVDRPRENVHSNAVDVAPVGFSVLISNALLGNGDEVARDASGSVRIAPVHEVVFTGEALARLGSAEAVAAAMQAAREVAAAKAAEHFRGMALGERVLADRISH